MADYAISYRCDRHLLVAEAIQRREEGAEPEQVDMLLEEIVDARFDMSRFEEMYCRLNDIPQRHGWPYMEPSDLESVQAERRQSPEAPRLDWDTLGERLHAAWIGRATGCLLGKPFEGVERAAIRAYLETHGEYPLRAYAPVPATEAERTLLNRSWPRAVRGRITGMTRDDDMDYSILALTMAEAHGADMCQEHVGEAWLLHLPYAGIYTAERMAYRNLVQDISPPESARRYNPYREWIGAQIRADMWGYLSAGDPARAADRAWCDAGVSHVKNGLYGAMFVSGMIGAAFVHDQPSAALQAGLDQIPSRSRLAEVIRTVREWHAGGLDWHETVDRIEQEYGYYHWVHTLNNAAIVVAALLYGAGNFATSVGLAVAGGWDADCNGATVGSVLGAMYGPHVIPSSFREPLHDRIESIVIGEAHNRISSLAERTLAVARRVAT